MIRVVNRIARPWEKSFMDVQDYAMGAGDARPTHDYNLRLNYVVKALKETGQWDEMDIFYAFSHDGSLNHKRLNYKSPGNFTAINVGSDPTSTVSGLGVGALDTQWIPSTHAVKYTQNSASYGCFFRFGYAGGTGSTGPMGMRNGSSNNFIVTGNSQNVRGRINGDTTNVTAGSGVFADNATYQMKRTSSTACEMFRNGVSYAGPASITSQSLNTLSAYLSGVNDNGVLAFAVNEVTYRIGFAFYGSSVLDPAILHTIFTQYYA